MQELDFIYRRHSIRQFQDTPVDAGHLREILKAATYAPTGKNLQNWHFVVVTNKEKINHIAHLVTEKNRKLAEYLAEAKKKPFQGMVQYHTVFKNAPALVLVYAGPYPTIADDLLEGGLMAPEEARRYGQHHPAIQNVSAAMENLQLAAAALGYGTCWMAGPTYAAQEIYAYLNFSKEGYYLAALTPLGVPVNPNPSYPPRKPVDEVTTIIE